MAGKFISLSSFPRAIVHIDCDAFFASVEQSLHPEYRGKPVITGKERGIVAAASYEAKRHGVKRGVKLWDVKKMCPDAIIVPSDYETYSLLSKRMFEIIRRYTPLVEEYSIDEAFAEITGLSRLRRKSYPDIAWAIKEDIEKSLGITVSVGLSLSKTLAKVGSKWKKPDGFTHIPGYKIHEYLGKWKLEDVWGIGPKTTAFCQALGMRTALDFAQKNEDFIKKYFTKPHIETWNELNGHLMYKINTVEKTDYANISKTKTFTPASEEESYVFAQLVKNLENAFIKVRRHRLLANGVVVFLKDADFRIRGQEVKFNRGTAFPNEILPLVKRIFARIFRQGTKYRATGIILTDVKEDAGIQMSLFEPEAKIETYRNIYSAIDELSEKYGKHVLHLGVSNLANVRVQHLKDRGDVPVRKLTRLGGGESKRKHLAIPMLLPKGEG